MQFYKPKVVFLTFPKENTSGMQKKNTSRNKIKK